MFDIGEERRINKAILEYIDYYSLNLEHLVVYTEGGSGIVDTDYLKETRIK